MLDELSGLCKDNEHRKDHPAFLAKLRFIDKELVRRKTGRSASHIENIEWLEQLLQILRVVLMTLTRRIHLLTNF